MKYFSFKQALKYADEEFSKYIRRRDALRSTGTFEYANCFTCGSTFPTAKMECGHGIPRTCKALRFHPKNGHAQCHSCNCHFNGMIREYKKNQVKCYGEEVKDELWNSRFGSAFSLKAPELLDLAHHFADLSESLTLETVREEWPKYPVYSERQRAGITLPNPNKEIFNT